MFEFKFKGIKTVPIFECDKKGIKQGKRTAMCWHTRCRGAWASEIFGREQEQPKHLSLPSLFYVKPCVSEAFYAPEVNVAGIPAP
jgi:hypothetical protein